MSSVKTIRFGPLEGFGTWDGRAHHTPGKLGEDGFPVGTYEDIPPDTDLMIEILPGRIIIFNQKVTHSHSQPFDPGKYGYSLKKNLPMPKDQPGAKSRCFTASGVFMVDVTEEQWRLLQSVEPRNVSITTTTRGPVFRCQICDHQSRTRIAAFLHESRDHYGIDPLKDTNLIRQYESGMLRQKTAQHSDDAASERLARRASEAKRSIKTTTAGPGATTNTDELRQDAAPAAAPKRRRRRTAKRKRRTRRAPAATSDSRDSASA